MHEKLKGKRIVLVEDNITNMAVFATTLRQHGVQVIQEPWNTNTVGFLLSHLPVDLILLDIMLRSGISGYDVFDQLQAEPRLRDIPVIGVSSLDAETEIPKAKEKGFAGFISKPISIVKFPDQLVACLEGEKVWVTSR